MMRLRELLFPSKKRAPRLDLQEVASKDHEALRRETELLAAQKSLETRIAVQSDIQRQRRRKPAI